MGWVYVDDQPAAAQQRGGCVGIGLWGLLFVVMGVMAWVIATDLGIRFAITDGPPGMTMPTAAIERRVAPAAAPRAPVAPVAPVQSSGTFETLPVPTIAPVVPAVERAPVVVPQQPAVIIEQAPSLYAELPAPGPAMNLIPEAAPEGGVPPAEVSSEINPNWRCDIFGECAK